MNVIEIMIAIIVVVSVVYISMNCVKLPDDTLYNAMNIKTSVFRDLSMMREFKRSISVLLITKDYKKLILGREFKRTEPISIKEIISSCESFGGEIEYRSIFPICAGTIYGKDWSVSFLPVTGYMNVKTNKR